MIFDVNKLKEIMDLVRNNPAYLPTRDKNGVLITFCNENAFHVAQSLVLNLFWNEKENRVMLANEMYDYMDSTPVRFSKFTDHLAAWDIANKGYLVYAAQQGEAHGHICPIYPNQSLETSGKWGVQVPVCSNVGAKNAVFGVNYAFADPPTYYMVIS